MAHALLTRIAALLTGAFMLIAGTASAQQALPPIDLFVFLDNSKTVFTGGPDGPNQRLAGMLKAAFSLPIDGARTFVTQGDQVSLYTFGKEVLPLAERIDGGNGSALTNAVNRFTDAITPDKITDFAPLLRAIAALPGLQDHTENRLKIVLIASDFIHDPSNQSANNQGTGVCDLLKQYRSTQKTAVSRDIDALRRTIAAPADGEQLPVYVGLLVVRPTEADFAATGGQYRDCALETVRLRPLTQNLEKELGAQTIEYADASKDLNAFAHDFVDSVLRATRPRLTVSSGTCLPRGIDGMVCTLTVRNPARVSSRLRAISLYDRADGPALATVNADRVLEGDSTQPIELRLSANEARSLLAGAAVFAGLDSEGRGASARVRIEKGAGGGLMITNAKAERAAVGQPAALQITLANPQPDAKTVRRIVFSTAEQGGASLGGVDLPSTAAPDLAGGTTKSLPPISLTKTIDEALDRGTVYAAVQSMDRERVNDPESPRVRIAYGRPAPLQVAEARVRTQDGRFLLDIDVVSPGPPNRPVRNVFFYGADGTSFASEPAPSGAAPVPSGGRVTLTLPLNDSALHALNGGGLAIAVDDALSGRESPKASVGRPPASSTNLRIDGLRWLENASAGELRARITVSNGNPKLRETLTGVVLRGASNERLVKRIEPSETLAQSASTNVVLTFDVRDSGFLALLRQPSVWARAMDDSDNEGPESDRLDTPRYSSLKLVSGMFEANDRGKLELRLEIENPALVPNRLNQVKMFGSGGRSEQAEPLPLPSPTPIAGLSRETIRIPFNKDFYRAHSPHLEQNVILLDENVQSASGRTPTVSFPIHMLPSKPLKLVGSLDWSDGLPLNLSLSVQNEAVYNQTLGRLLLAAAEGKEPEVFDPPNGVEIRGASSEGAKITPISVRLSVPIHDEWQERLMTGQALQVCALTDHEMQPPPKTCPAGWTSVALPRPKPLQVQMNKDRPFDAQRREVRIDVENTGIVPNAVTGYALQSSDGKRDILAKTLEKPVLVKPGKTITLPLPLSEEEARDIIRAQLFRVAVRDRAPESSETGNPLSSTGVEVKGGISAFDYQFSNLKAVKVPGKEPYTTISVDIEIKNTLRADLGKQTFDVWVTDADGSEIGGKVTVSHTFSGSEWEYVAPVAWGFSGHPFKKNTKGYINIKSTRNPENYKNYEIIFDNIHDVKPILIVIGIAASLAFFAALGKFFFMRHNFPQFTKNKKETSAFKIIETTVGVLGLIGVTPATIYSILGVLGIIEYFSFTTFIIVITILSLFLVVASLLARMFRADILRRIAVRGEKAKEMPALIHNFESRIIMGSAVLFIFSASILWAFAAYYTVTDPRTVEYHWDYREANSLTTAQK